MGSQTIQLFGTVDDSIVDGPGIRLAIFTQGCSHHCPGCHNPKAQPFAGGSEATVAELVDKVRENPLLAGVTLTGGEPFDQALALVELARQVRALGKTVWAYSGYTYEDLAAGEISEAARELLEHCDVLVDGLFIEAQRSLDLRWKGSANQRVIDLAASREAGELVEWVAR